MSGNGKTGLQMLPKIRRARGYRVYDSSGIRYLDFYLDGGRAILGHRPRGYSQALKNILGKGLSSRYPSVYEGRLRKILGKMFPGFTEIRLYHDEYSAAYAAAKAVGLDQNRDYFKGPLFHGTLYHQSEKGLSLWMPYLPVPDILPEVLIPILPIFFGIQPVCFRNTPCEDVPESQIISPVILGIACRNLHEYSRSGETYNEELWRQFDSPVWKRTGPYLFPNGVFRDYTEIFRLFLKEGLILPPYPELPAIIPGEFSPGELALFKRLSGQITSYLKEAGS